MSDFTVHDEGSVVLINPLSPAAKDWLDEHAVTESWQWWAGMLAVEHRYAQALIEAMQEEGLVCDAE